MIRALRTDAQHVFFALFKRIGPDPEIGGKEFEGVLTAWDAGTITVSIETVPNSAGRKKKSKEGQSGPENSSRAVVIPRKDIAVLRLYLDI